MNLFKERIENWQDWENVFCSVAAFTPLIEQIFRLENLPFAGVENLKPGTNAVFKVGGYVIKIFKITSAQRSIVTRTGTVKMFWLTMN